MRLPAAPASVESRFAAGALALAYLFPQSTAETWAVKWPAMAWVMLIAATWLGSRTKSRRSDGISWAWAPLAAWAAASPLWSLYPHRTLVQAIFLACGMMTVFHGRGRIGPASAATCIIGIGAAELLVQGFQLAGSAAGWTDVPRLFGSFVNANHHAALLVAAYGAAAARAVCARRSEKTLLFVFALLFLAGAELSKSRAVLLAVPLMLGVLWLGKPAGFDRRAFGALAALSLLLLMSPAGPARRVAGALSGDDEFSWKRSEIWTCAMKMVRERPLGGVGLGSFGDAFPAVRPRRLAIYAADYAHSEPAQLAAEAGLIGFGLGIWLAVIAALMLKNQFKGDPTKAGLVLALLGVGAFALTDFPMHVPILAVIVVVSLAASLPERRDRTVAHHASVRAALYGVGAIMAVWLGSCGISDFYYARGARAAASGLPDAAEHIEKALRFWPNNSEALNAKGQLSSNGREADFLAARRLRPAWLPPLNGLFDLALERGSLVEAEAARRSARKLDPYGLETGLMDARLDSASGRIRESERKLDELEMQWSGHIDLTLARAELEIKRGRFRSAERIIRRVLSLYPMNGGARRMLDNLQ